jgi:hypothetical protein
MNTASDMIHLSRAEANFRAMAFRIVYNNVFANVGDLTMRFACAIAYSARVMKDRRLFESWWAWTGGRSMKGLLESGNEPPEALRPFVESYLRAVEGRADQTGDDIADLI